MEQAAVASSNIRSIGYDEPSETLEVEFHSGSIYQYYNFPQHMYEQFGKHPSKGKFLNAYVKDAYPYSRVG